MAQPTGPGPLEKAASAVSAIVAETLAVREQLTAMRAEAERLKFAPNSGVPIQLPPQIGVGHV
jgi:hypothetical protein